LEFRELAFYAGARVKIFNFVQTMNCALSFVQEPANSFKVKGLHLKFL